MILLIANEFKKLHSTRAPWLALLATQLLVVLGVTGLMVGNPDPEATDTALGAIGHAGLMSLIALVLGVSAVAGEYRHKTITDTYLGAPRRGQVITAKLVAYTGWGVAFGLACAVTAVAATAVWLAQKGTSLDLSQGAVWQTIAGGILWNAAFAAIGVGLGALIRNLAGAIAAAAAWLVVIEGIVGQLVTDAARWLPFASGAALNHLPSATSRLPQLGAALVLVAYAAVFALVAVSTTVRRDVT